MQVISQADQRPTQNHKDEILPVLPQELYLLVKEIGPLLNQEKHSISDYAGSKKCNVIFNVIHKMYKEKMMERLNSGESKTIFRNISCIVIIGLTTSGRKAWQEEEETRKDIQYCTDSSGAILYLRALQGHSGRSLIDPTLQDNVIIPSGFFQYIYHVGCAINLHSIINSGLIPGGQNLSNRQTVFFLPVDPMDKNHKDPDTIDLNEPRHAQYMHKAWKKHQTYSVLGRQQPCSEERIEVLSDTIERNHSSRNTPSLLYSESCSDGNWRSHIRESIHASPRPPPKISLKHDWKKELGSEVAQRPEGQVVQQF